MANKNENPSNLFREKSVERISAPEDLNDYVRVATPGVWMIMIAIIAILVGFAIWAVNGELETTVPAVVVSSDGHTDCFVSEKGTVLIEEGMTVRINNSENTEVTILTISKDAIEAEDVLSDYAMHVVNLERGEWIHAVQLSDDVQDGTFSAVVVTETINPIKFLFS